MLKSNSVAVFSMLPRLAAVGQDGEILSDMVGFFEVDGRRSELDGWVSLDPVNKKPYISFNSNNSDDLHFYGGELYACEEVNGRLYFRGQIRPTGSSVVSAGLPEFDDFELGVYAETDILNGTPVNSVEIHGRVFPYSAAYKAVMGMNF
jgi:hypothetical protein